MYAERRIVFTVERVKTETFEFHYSIRNYLFI